MKKLLIIYAVSLFTLPAIAAPPTRTDTYVSGQTIDPAAVTRNEGAIFTYLQDGVDTLASNTVTSADIVDGAVATADLATNAVTNIKVADNAIDTAELVGNAVTGAKIAMGSDAQGDVLYYNGTDYARLGYGTSGQVLTTKGAAANPEWADGFTGPGTSTDNAIARYNGTGGDTVQDSSTITISDNGELVNTSQPAFLAFSSGITNITAGSYATFPFSAEIFDQNSDFDLANETFTAPVTGKYLFTIICDLQEIDNAASVTYNVSITASNRSVTCRFESAALVADDDFTFTLVAIVDMDSSDTCLAQIRQLNGANQTDLLSSSSFSGGLLF
jgi:hypothetical protein